MHDDMREIRISLIAVADNVRRGELEVDDLVESIRDRGLLQPILVRRHGDGYELVAGHRRLEACKRLGIVRIPALIHDGYTADRLAIQLAENVQREHLSHYDVALALRRMRDESGLSITQISKAVRKSYPWVIQHLDFADIHDGLAAAGVAKELLERLSYDAALELKHVPIADQVAMVKQIVPADSAERRPSARKMRQLVEAKRTKPREPRPGPQAFLVEVDELEISVHCECKLQRQRVVQLLLEHGGTRTRGV